ncbi:MAG: VOC family protein [Parvularcula sp.]|nr:VOC family protein [Parvularcula sp.]
MVAELLFLIGFAAGLAGCQTPQYRDERVEGGTVDHIVFAVPDLQVATDHLAGVLGISPVRGGEHVALGTENTLFSLGGRQYFEILGPSRNQAELQPFGAALASKDRPDILTFAVETDNLEEIVRVAEEIGLETSGIANSSRVMPDGQVLRYRSVLVISQEFRGLVPFFIDWGDGPHPGLTSPEGATLKYLEVLSPDPAKLARIYSRLGIKVPVKAGLAPAIIAEVKSASGQIVLVGSGDGLGG